MHARTRAHTYTLISLKKEMDGDMKTFIIPCAFLFVVGLWRGSQNWPYALTKGYSNPTLPSTKGAGQSDSIFTHHRKCQERDLEMHINYEKHPENVSQGEIVPDSVQRVTYCDDR